MCRFCEELESWKEAHEKPEYKNNKFIYGCMLYMYMKDRKGSLTSRPHDLNYCPECGKKISAGE
nr:MAG TPA: DNA polymerase eta [Caudoviricetes sp.]